MSTEASTLTPSCSFKESYHSINSSLTSTSQVMTRVYPPGDMPSRVYFHWIAQRRTDLGRELGVFLKSYKRRILCRQPLELVGLDDGQAGALDGDPLIAAKLVQQPRHRLARGAGHIGDLFVGEGHGKADLRLAVGGSASPVQQQASEPPGRRAGERQALGIVKDSQVLAGERLRRVHAGDAVAAQEVNKLLLANRLHLAGLDGFRGHLMGNVGQNGAEAHHVAGAGDL